MNHWEKYIICLYSLIVIFRFDAISYLVQMGTHNHWSISQQLFQNKWNKYQMTETTHFKYIFINFRQYGEEKKKGDVAAGNEPDWDKMWTL